LLVVANLSRFAQSVELDLAEFAGLVPVELFGRTPFHAVGRGPYVLTLSAHSFYWFSLEPQWTGPFSTANGRDGEELPVLRVTRDWTEVFHRQAARARLEESLPAYINGVNRRNGVPGAVKAVTVREAVPIPCADALAYLTLVEVEMGEGERVTRLLPMTLAASGEFAASGEEASRILETQPHAVVGYLEGGSKGLLYDALASPTFCTALLEAITRGSSFQGVAGGQVRCALTAPARHAGEGDGGFTLLPAELPPPALSRAEQLHTSVFFGDQWVLKVFRRVEKGVNPEVEVGRYLTEKFFPYTPPVFGTIEYRRPRDDATTLAVLQGYLANEGDAWQYTLDELGRFFERVLTLPGPARGLPVLPAVSLLERAGADLPAQANELIDTYLASARLLGHRTAELHLALAADTEDAAFTPEPFSKLYQRSLYQSMRGLKGRVFASLSQNLDELPESARDDARQVLGRGDDILQRFRAVLDQKITAVRTRCHGDYHLGQVLYTGKDFAIIDFAGEETRSLSERRLKRSPLADVVSMVRSFHYAAYGALLGQEGGRGVIRPEDLAVLQPWALFWYAWVSAAFLRSYLDAADEAPFLPRTAEERRALFNPLLLEKALAEMGRELDRQSAWVGLPLKGVLQLLDFDA
jgi:maltose alpha-D-glucosyltransferase/alpha-amylase